MKEGIPKLDLPVDFIVGDYITGEILSQYGLFPCKIKAGIHVLCLQGRIRATINLTEHTIGAFDYVTLLPNSFLQIREVSPDVRLYFAGFSSAFMAGIHFIKSYMNFLPAIIENPVMPLPEPVARLYEGAYALLIRAPIHWKTKRSLSPS